jgi:hypothetical protein
MKFIFILKYCIVHGILLGYRYCFKLVLYVGGIFRPKGTITQSYKRQIFINLFMSLKLSYYFGFYIN